MQLAEQQTIKKEIKGCQITLSFSSKPVDGVMEKIQSILSNAYEKRVQNNLADMVSLKFPYK